MKSVERYGKFLVLDLERPRGASGGEEIALLVHLGMTGQIVTCAAEAPEVAHTHVFLTLDDGRELRYTDARRFGRMRGFCWMGSARAYSDRLASIRWRRAKTTFGMQLQNEVRGLRRF